MICQEATGRQILMLRKGGIREPGSAFGVEHRGFFLFPTYFHENAADLAPPTLARLPAVAAAAPPAGELHLDITPRSSVSGRVRPSSLSLAKPHPPGKGLIRRSGLVHYLSSMITLLLRLLRLLPVLLGGHRQLALENLALRQQLAVYKRMMTRPRLRRADHLFFLKRLVKSTARWLHQLLRSALPP